MNKTCLLAVASGAALLFLAGSAHAQSASAVFNGPPNMDAGLQSGLNALTGYIAVLPLCAKRLEIKGVAASCSLRIAYLDGRLPGGPNGAGSEVCR
jgi:hypothetical protein